MLPLASEMGLDRSSFRRESDRKSERPPLHVTPLMQDEIAYIIEFAILIQQFNAAVLPAEADRILGSILPQVIQVEALYDAKKLHSLDHMLMLANRHEMARTLPTDLPLFVHKTTRRLASLVSVLPMETVTSRTQTAHSLLPSFMSSSGSGRQSKDKQMAWDRLKRVFFLIERIFSSPLFHNVSLLKRAAAAKLSSLLLRFSVLLLSRVESHGRLPQHHERRSSYSSLQDLSPVKDNIHQEEDEKKNSSVWDASEEESMRFFQDMLRQSLGLLRLMVGTDNGALDTLQGDGEVYFTQLLLLMCSPLHVEYGWVKGNVDSFLCLVKSLHPGLLQTYLMRNQLLSILMERIHSSCDMLLEQQSSSSAVTAAEHTQLILLIVKLCLPEPSHDIRGLLGPFQEHGGFVALSRSIGACFGKVTSEQLQTNEQYVSLSQQILAAVTHMAVCLYPPNLYAVSILCQILLQRVTDQHVVDLEVRYNAFYTSDMKNSRAFADVTPCVSLPYAFRSDALDRLYDIYNQVPPSLLANMCPWEMTQALLAQVEENEPSFRTRILKLTGLVVSKMASVHTRNNNNSNETTTSKKTKKQQQHEAMTMRAGTLAEVQHQLITRHENDKYIQQTALREQAMIRTFKMTCFPQRDARKPGSSKETLGTLVSLLLDDITRETRLELLTFCMQLLEVDDEEEEVEVHKKKNKHKMLLFRYRQQCLLESGLLFLLMDFLQNSLPHLSGDTLDFIERKFPTFSFASESFDASAVISCWRLLSILLLDHPKAQALFFQGQGFLLGLRWLRISGLVPIEHDVIFPSGVRLQVFQVVLQVIVSLVEFHIFEEEEKNELQGLFNQVRRGSSRSASVKMNNNSSSNNVPSHITSLLNSLGKKQEQGESNNSESDQNSSYTAAETYHTQLQLSPSLFLESVLELLPTFTEWSRLCSVLTALRTMLRAGSKGHVKALQTVFRQKDGFKLCLEILGKPSHHDLHSKDSDIDTEELLVIRHVMLLLHAALRQHPENQQIWREADGFALMLTMLSKRTRTNSGSDSKMTNMGAAVNAAVDSTPAAKKNHQQRRARRHTVSEWKYSCVSMWLLWIALDFTTEFSNQGIWLREDEAQYHVHDSVSQRTQSAPLPVLVPPNCLVPLALAMPYLPADRLFEGKDHTHDESNKEQLPTSTLKIRYTFRMPEAIQPLLTLLPKAATAVQSRIAAYILSLCKLETSNASALVQSRADTLETLFNSYKMILLPPFSLPSAKSFTKEHTQRKSSNARLTPHKKSVASQHPFATYVSSGQRDRVYSTAAEVELSMAQSSRYDSDSADDETKEQELSRSFALSPLLQNDDSAFDDQLMQLELEAGETSDADSNYGGFSSSDVNKNKPRQMSNAAVNLTSDDCTECTPSLHSLKVLIGSLYRFLLGFASDSHLLSAFVPQEDTVEYEAVRRYTFSLLQYQQHLTTLWPFVEFDLRPAAVKNSASQNNGVQKAQVRASTASLEVGPLLLREGLSCWPPSHTGFTLSLWLMVDTVQNDNTYHTTLFTVAASDGKSLFAVNLRDGHVVLQVDANDSVIFARAPRLVPHTWMHLVLVLTPPEQQNVHVNGQNQTYVNTHSIASLYLNGTLHESLRVAFPRTTISPFHCHFGSSAATSWALQAVKWRLARALLLIETMTEDEVFGFHVASGKVHENCSFWSRQVATNAVIVNKQLIETETLNTVLSEASVPSSDCQHHQALYKFWRNTDSVNATRVYPRVPLPVRSDRIAFYYHPKMSYTWKTTTHRHDAHASNGTVSNLVTQLSRQLRDAPTSADPFANASHRTSSLVVELDMTQDAKLMGQTHIVSPSSLLDNWSSVEDKLIVASLLLAVGRSSHASQAVDVIRLLTLCVAQNAESAMEMDTFCDQLIAKTTRQSRAPSRRQEEAVSKPKTVVELLQERQHFTGYDLLGFMLTKRLSFINTEMIASLLSLCGVHESGQSGYLCNVAAFHGLILSLPFASLCILNPDAVMQLIQSCKTCLLPAENTHYERNHEPLLLFFYSLLKVYTSAELNLAIRSQLLDFMFVFLTHVQVTTEAFQALADCMLVMAVQTPSEDYKSDVKQNWSRFTGLLKLVTRVQDHMAYVMRSTMSASSSSSRTAATTHQSFVDFDDDEMNRSDNLPTLFLHVFSVSWVEALLAGLLTRPPTSDTNSDFTCTCLHTSYNTAETPRKAATDDAELLLDEDELMIKQLETAHRAKQELQEAEHVFMLKVLRQLLALLVAQTAHMKVFVQTDFFLSLSFLLSSTPGAVTCRQLHALLLNAACNTFEDQWVSSCLALTAQTSLFGLREAHALVQEKLLVPRAIVLPQLLNVELNLLRTYVGQSTVSVKTSVDAAYPLLQGVMTCFDIYFKKSNAFRTLVSSPSDGGTFLRKIVELSFIVIEQVQSAFVDFTLNSPEKKLKKQERRRARSVHGKRLVFHEEENSTTNSVLKVEEEGWKCPRCNYMNEDVLFLCDSCLLPQPADSETAKQTNMAAEEEKKPAKTPRNRRRRRQNRMKLLYPALWGENSSPEAKRKADENTMIDAAPTLAATAAPGAEFEAGMEEQAELSRVFESASVHCITSFIGLVSLQSLTCHREEDRSKQTAVVKAGWTVLKDVTQSHVPHWVYKSSKLYYQLCVLAWMGENIRSNSKHWISMCKQSSILCQNMRAMLQLSRDTLYCIPHVESKRPIVIVHMLDRTIRVLCEGFAQLLSHGLSGFHVYTNMFPRMSPVVTDTMVKVEAETVSLLESTSLVSVLSDMLILALQEQHARRKGSSQLHGSDLQLVATCKALEKEAREMSLLAPAVHAATTDSLNDSLWILSMLKQYSGVLIGLAPVIVPSEHPPSAIHKTTGNPFLSSLSFHLFLMLYLHGRPELESRVLSQEKTTNNNTEHQQQQPTRSARSQSQHDMAFAEFMDAEAKQEQGKLQRDQDEHTRQLRKLLFEHTIDVLSTLVTVHSGLLLRTLLTTRLADAPRGRRMDAPIGNDAKFNFTTILALLGSRDYDGVREWVCNELGRAAGTLLQASIGEAYTDEWKRKSESTLVQSLQILGSETRLTQRNFMNESRMKMEKLEQGKLALWKQFWFRGVTRHVALPSAGQDHEALSVMFTYFLEKMKTKKYEVASVFRNVFQQSSQTPPQSSEEQDEDKLESKISSAADVEAEDKRRLHDVYMTLKGDGKMIDKQKTTSFDRTSSQLHGSHALRRSFVDERQQTLAEVHLGRLAGSPSFIMAALLRVDRTAMSTADVDRLLLLEQSDAFKQSFTGWETLVLSSTFSLHEALQLFKMAVQFPRDCQVVLDELAWRIEAVTQLAKYPALLATTTADDDDDDVPPREAITALERLTMSDVSVSKLQSDVMELQLKWKWCEDMLVVLRNLPHAEFVSRMLKALDVAQEMIAKIDLTPLFTVSGALLGGDEAKHEDSFARLCERSQVKWMALEPKLLAQQQQELMEEENDEEEMMLDLGI